MSIRAGQGWGDPGRLPEGAPRAASDAELHDLVAAGERGPVGLRGGDLFRTVGGSADVDRLDTEHARHLPVDLAWIQLDDGPERPMVAHLVARSATWTGALHAVFNAEFLGTWDVAPRSHPGDGRVELIDASGMPVRDRWMARSRLPTGSHVPHPDIEIRRVRSADVTMARRRRVWIDGRRVGSARRLRVRVEPDAVVIVV